MLFQSRKNDGIRRFKRETHKLQHQQRPLEQETMLRLATSRAEDFAAGLQAAGEGLVAAQVQGPRVPRGLRDARRRRSCASRA